jgi:uncharacterized protein YciI
MPDGVNRCVLLLTAVIDRADPRANAARLRGADRHPDWAGRRYREYRLFMFVIELIYKADLAAIDAHMPAHMKFLKKYYAAGNFLVSGRKIPREGGIIVAVGKSRQELEAIMKEDPFCTHGLADVRIIEFRASQRADDIQRRMDNA